MTERITRENDTVRATYLSSTLEISPDPDNEEEGFRGDERNWEVAMIYRPSRYDTCVRLKTPDLAALAAELHSLAGEPDWRTIAKKLHHVVKAHEAIEQATRERSIGGSIRSIQDLRGAMDAIAAEEWAALEGAGDE